MRANRTPPSLCVFYLLLVGVGSILAHLASEFAAMGSEADNLVFSPRHAYLGFSALVGIGILIVRGRAVLVQSSGGRDLKRILSLGLDALPFGGKGVRYYAFTAGLQLAVGALTQIGEGCPFCGHDVIVGVLGALLTVLLLALITRAVGRRLPTLVCALIGYMPSLVATRATTFARSDRGGAIAILEVWFPLLFNRPPPPLQTLATSSL